MMLARNSGKMLPEHLRQISDASNSRWYRPLFELSLAGTWRLFALNPIGYHAINFLLYAVDADFVAWLGRHLAQDRRVGWLSGLIFATHACHAEPVVWIAAGHEIFAATAALFSFMLYIRFRESQRWGWWWGSVLLYVIGLGFKETVLALPLFLICYDFIFTFSSSLKASEFKIWRPNRWKLNAQELLPLLPTALGGLAYLVYRLQVGGGYEVSFNLLSVFKNVAYYLLMEIVALPVSTHFLIRVPLWTWPMMALLGLASSFCVGVAKKQIAHSRPLWFGGIWMVSALAPVSLIVTERTTYFSSVGWAWAIASVLVLAWDAHAKKSPMLKRRLVALSVIIILGANVVTLSHRNYWWHRAGTISQEVFGQVQASLERSTPGEEVQFLFFNLPYRIEYAYAFGNRPLFAVWLLQSQHQIEAQTEAQVLVFEEVTMDAPPRVHLEQWLSERSATGPIVAFYWQDGDVLRLDTRAKGDDADE